MQEKKDNQRQRFESLLGHHLQRRATLAPPLAAGDHLDNDALAAFTEGRLSEAESTPIISHLIDCNFCRHTTANLLRLAAEMGEFERELVSPPAPESGRIRQLLDRLAASVLPTSDDSAVFAYHARAEETEESDVNNNRDSGEVTKSDTETEPAPQNSKEAK